MKIYPMIILLSISCSIPFMTIHRVEDKQAEARATHGLTDVSRRKVEFDYLRAFVIILVLFVHASLAYTTSAFINFENPIATSSPVVNEQRWIGFDLIVALNETFLHAAVVFCLRHICLAEFGEKGCPEIPYGGRLTRLGLPICHRCFVPDSPGLLPGAAPSRADYRSGLQLWSILARNGPIRLRDRWPPLVLVAAAGIQLPVYPPVPGSSLSLEVFGRGRVEYHSWSPRSVFWSTAWNLNNCVPAYCNHFRTAEVDWPSGPLMRRPAGYCSTWCTSLRALQSGQSALTAVSSKLTAHSQSSWWEWVAVGLMSFTVFIIMVVVVTPMERTIVSEITFVVCCWAIVSGMTGLFLRFGKRRVDIFDSLSENTYGIYIVHYVFVTWLQYFMLGRGLAPSVKGIAVFVGTLILSWGTVAAIRRIPVVAKVI